MYQGLCFYHEVLFEEQKLLRDFGQEYADDKSPAPMLLPGLKWSGNKNFLVLVLIPRSSVLIFVSSEKV
jgi:hypothetical protein